MTAPSYRFLLSLMLLTSALLCSAQGSWEPLQLPTEQHIQSVYFLDSLSGWVAGDSGLILHTADGGENWVHQTSNTTNSIVDVFFIDPLLGWATAFNFEAPPYGTLLLHTVNGGQLWTPAVYQDENVFLNCIFFLDSLNGWMGGSPHALIHTTDGGLNWEQAQIDTSTLAFFPVLSIQFYNEQYGYASGGMFDIAGVTWRTNNGGANWYAIDVADAPADEVHALYLIDSTHVIGSGGDPDFGYGVGFIRTTDGGNQWEYDEIGIQGIAYDIDFVNKQEAWAPLGPRRKFIYSTDTAKTWTEIPTPESTAIYDVTFPDSLHGFAVGENGAMLQFIPEGHVGTNEYGVFQNELGLQNFPNPFRDKTTIRFQIPTNHMNAPSIQIKVYDIFGHEVFAVTKRKREPGVQLIHFEAGDLPAGIYYYQLILGSHIAASNRMVVTR